MLIVKVTGLARFSRRKGGGQTGVRGLPGRRLSSAKVRNGAWLLASSRCARVPRAPPTASISRPSPTPDRCRSKRRRPYPSRSSIATIVCCAPSPRPKANGDYRSSRRMSIRITSRCSSHSRTSASTATTASIRKPSLAPCLQMVRHARIVSGGSTLTMQVARLLDGKHERTPGGKLRQMVRALELERALVENGNSEALSAAGAVRRQPRRRQSRVAGLFRQRAAPAFARGIGAARRAAAVARSAPPRSQPRSGTSRPQPRFESRRRGACHHGCGRGEGQGGAHPDDPPRVPDAGAASR